MAMKIIGGDFLLPSLGKVCIVPNTVLKWGQVRSTGLSLRHPPESWSFSTVPGSITGCLQN